MSVARSQAQTFLRLVKQLRGRWRTDLTLPAAIQKLLTSERSFGSRDRRLYRELIYTTLRYLPWIEPLLDTNVDEAVRRVAWLANETPATKLFKAELATGESPAALGDKTELLPAWFREHCPTLFAGTELETQLRRAQLWLRLQTKEPQRVFDEFTERGWKWEYSSVLPEAIALRDEVDVTQTEAFKRGAIEVQDLGSQMILESVGIAPGERWLDACAGAGGKSLQLARLLGNGTVEAHDIRARALEELHLRATRAGIRNIQINRAPSAGAFDGVLVDAPCSGSGTWRRAPHLKWATTPAMLAARVELQREVLARFAAMARPGGRLVYATCSMSSHENEGVVADFLAKHPDFKPEPFARTFGFAVQGSGFTIMPSAHDTDGFFVASLRRA